MYNKDITCTNTNNGYLYFCDSKHPLADSNGRIYYHRHIASIKINRWLLKDEHVHHIDGDKLNNDPSNLEILTRQEHAKLHKPTNYKTIGCGFCKTLFLQNTNNEKFCSRKCSTSFLVKDKTITKEVLDELIPKTSWRDLGKMFGYSDNGIKKRAIALGCDIKNLKNSHSLDKSGNVIA
jgi:hypothetical protein